MEHFVTEERARKRWCPLARTIYTDGHSFAGASNRDSNGGVISSCIASKCMAWRWGPTPWRSSSKFEQKGWEYVSAEDSGDGVDMWVEPEEKWLARRIGYCGQFGRPGDAS